MICDTVITCYIFPGPKYFPDLVTPFPLSLGLRFFPCMEEKEKKEGERMPTMLFCCFVRIDQTRTQPPPFLSSPRYPRRTRGDKDKGRAGLVLDSQRASYS